MVLQEAAGNGYNALEPWSLIHLISVNTSVPESGSVPESAYKGGLERDPREMCATQSCSNKEADC